MNDESENARMHYSPSQLVGVLDTASDGICCIDQQGNCTFSNASCLRLLGCEKHEDLLGVDMHDLIHGKKRGGKPCEKDSCQIYGAFREGTKIRIDDDVFCKKDGSSLNVTCRCQPLEDDCGNKVGTIVTFSDISQRKSEEACRSKLMQMVDSSVDAMISRDLNGVITSWNEGASRIYGFSKDEAIGQTTSLIQLEDHAEEDRNIENAIQHGDGIGQLKTKRQRNDGVTCEVSTTVFPLRDSAGNIVGSASIDRDISDQCRAHDELLKAKSAAESAESLANSANRTRAQFLANISHELRTPMNAILGMIQLSLDEKLDPTVEDYLSTAKSSADSLLELVNELLDFSKMEAGKFEINPEPFNLFETIDTTAKSLSAKAGEKGIELFCEVDSEISSSLIGDARRIQQVIINLVSNAIKFTDEGEIVINVARVESTDNQEVLKFSVSDTGIGIKQKDRKRIFSPFAQADMSSTREHFGTGLGLSICQDLLSLMDSQLELDSEVGVGSTFSFEVEFDVNDESSTSNFPTELVKNRQVLIVDDNKTNLRILEKVFTNWSMHPITARDGQQALRILKRKQAANDPVPLVLVDGMMPGMDGFELVDKITEDEEVDVQATIIMHSTAELSVFSEKKKESSAKAYVMKPVSQSELLNAVIESLDLYVQPSNPNDLFRSSDLPVKPLQILLVEDLEANRKVATAILKKRGHEVTIAKNGHVALETLQNSEKRFDVILMDVQMPVMDGLQATSAIRNLDCDDRSTTPIIAMTAHALDGDREECLAAGMDSYIPKPLDAKKLVWLTETVTHDPLKVQRNISRQKNFYHNGAKLSATSNDESKKLLDLDSALKRLGGDQELFKEFVAIFLEDAPGMMKEIEDGLNGNDAGAVEKSSHALKGLVSNFGAKECVDVSLKLEKAGREGDLSKSPKDFGKLQTLYETLCAELKEHA